MRSLSEQLADIQLQLAAGKATSGRGVKVTSAKGEQVTFASCAKSSCAKSRKIAPAQRVKATSKPSRKIASAKRGKATSKQSKQTAPAKGGKPAPDSSIPPVAVAKPSSKLCPYCGIKLKGHRYDNHVAKAHRTEILLASYNASSLNIRLATADDYTQCSICGGKLQLKELQAHIDKHIDTRRQKTKRASAALTAEARKAIEDSDLGGDQNIADYLKNNPVKVRAGTVGLPQDKYRYGFYGNKSMEYDVWRKP